jgi:hypothetical protein
MVEVEGRYDMLRVYLPRRRMISVAESMARQSDVRLRLPKPGFDDYIIASAALYKAAAKAHRMQGGKQR